MQLVQAQLPDLACEINPSRPRRGHFSVRTSDEQLTFVETVDPQRPFVNIKALDIDETAAGIVSQLRSES